MSLLVAAFLTLLAAPRVPGLFEASPDPDLDAWLPTMYYRPLLAAIGFGITLVLVRRRAPRGWVPWMIPVVAAMSLVGASWSLAPRVAFVNGGLLLTVAALGVGAGRTMGAKEMLRGIAMAVTTILLLSAIYIFVGERMGVVATAGGTAWRGAFTNQNDFGRWLVIGLILVLLRLRRRGLARVCWAGVAAILAYAIFRTESAQAVGTALLAGLFVLLVCAARSGTAIRRFVLLCILGLTLTLGWVAATPHAGITLLGGDATLTNRTPLWGALVEPIRERAFGGYGLRAFWLTDHPGLWEVRHTVGFGAAHAHNTFVEALLAFGIPMGVLFGLWFVWETVRALTHCVRAEAVDDSRVGLASIGGLILVYSMSASMFFAGTLTWWFLFAIIVSMRPERGSVPQKKLNLTVNESKIEKAHDV